MTKISIYYFQRKADREGSIDITVSTKDWYAQLEMKINDKGKIIRKTEGELETSSEISSLNYVSLYAEKKKDEWMNKSRSCRTYDFYIKICDVLDEWIQKKLEINI